MPVRLPPMDYDCPFRDQAAAVLQRLRAALAAVVAAVSPGSLAKAADLQRELNIDRKLSWKVFKVIRAGQPLSAGPHVPGPANLADFLRAAADHGVPSDLIAAAASAGEEFQRVVEAHAGDRTAFDSMIDGLTEPESDQINLQHKRAAFRANRHIWGVQATTHFYCVVVQPSAGDPERVSIAVLQGYRDLQRLRLGGSLVIGRISLTDDQGQVREVSRRPLDPGVSDSSGIALIRGYCTQPLPELRSVRSPAGIVSCELVSNDLGKRSAVTLVHGYSMCPTLPRRRAPGNEVFGTTVRVQFPCEVLVSDLLVRRDTWGPLRPNVRVYGLRSPEAARSALPDDCDLLPMRESVTWIGRGCAVLHTPDFPDYPQLAAWAFAQLGWDAEQFDTYRCRIEYPVMPATVVLDAPLPEQLPS